MNIPCKINYSLLAATKLEIIEVQLGDNEIDEDLMFMSKVLN